MIFISHNSKDKNIIEPIAQELAHIFGMDKVFYDSWSIQPGDSLIGKIDKGLEECQFFVLFVSANSLKSEMVKIEWRNALLKATKGNLKFIPVRLEKIQMPTILTDTLFIDATSSSQKDIVQQITDVIKGDNTYKDDKVGTGFHNLIAYIKEVKDGFEIEFTAQQFTEPISRYLIIVGNEEEEITHSCVGESMYEVGFKKDLEFNNGDKKNAILFAIDRPTVPGFPFIVSLKKKTNTEIKILGAMKANTSRSFISIPLV